MKISKKIKKNIVVLGSGFGGIKCALHLNKIAKINKKIIKDFNIVLVDKNNYHLYTPSLYEVATTAKADASGVVLKKVITTKIEDIIKKTYIKFIQGEVEKIDLKNKKIYFTDNTSLDFEYLVLALGAEPEYFGIEGLKKYSYPLKWLSDAIKIRNKIRQEFLLKDNNGTLKIIVGGSGPNGVEFASELSGYIRQLNKIHKKNVKQDITLIDGAPHILPGFEHTIVKRAQKRIKKLNIKTINNFVIEGVDEFKVYIKQLPLPNQPEENFTPTKKTLNYDILIWSGGVRANKLLENLNIPKEKRQRAETDPLMKCYLPDQHLDIKNNVFAIGDNSCFLNPETSKPVPQTAKVAIKQAKIAAENIANSILKKPKKLYKYKDYSFSIPVGGKHAITKWGPFVFSGFFGWIAKQFIELYYLWSITQKPSVLFVWLKGIRIFSKND